MLSVAEFIALICLIWSLFILLVQFIGILSIFHSFSSQPRKPHSPTRVDAPHVTIVRPVKGLEPYLYECIASSFLQNYPLDKLSIRLCVDSANDPAHPLLKKLIEDFPKHDAKVLVEAEDPFLHGPDAVPTALGPNPKIRNISRAYREAKGDIIWINDCNVWVGREALGRMVDKLTGRTPGQTSARPYKFVHHLPIVVDIVDYSRTASIDEQNLLSSASEAAPSTDLIKNNVSNVARVRANGGGRLDEMFMATSHAKFYGAINAIGVAPCIVGKSNMFRKSHLDQATDPARNPNIPKDEKRRPGVDYFSYNICEDHLIGEILWRTRIQGYLNHGLMWGDLVTQPMAGMAIYAYVARRVRWLRARKFTVLPATVVEPGVESLLCCAYFAFALTTLPWCNTNLNIPPTWSAALLIWMLSISVWMIADWKVYCRLHSGSSIEIDSDTPTFAKGRQHGGPRRRFVEWLPAWFGREVMALPIWTWAVLLGMEVNWRGKTFAVNFDARVVEKDVKPRSERRGRATPELERGRRRSKDRVD